METNISTINREDINNEIAEKQNLIMQLETEILSLKKSAVDYGVF